MVSCLVVTLRKKSEMKGEERRLETAMRSWVATILLSMLTAVGCSSSNSAGDGGTDADADSDGDTDSETETDSDTLLPAVECGEDGDCASPLVCNELWGLCVVGGCAEQDDFTLHSAPTPENHDACASRRPAVG